MSPKKICTLCSKEISLSNFAKHLRTHGIRQPQLECAICVKSVPARNFKVHMKRHEKDCLRCTDCPKFCAKSLADLNYHKAKKHSDRTPLPLTNCALCGKTYKDRYALAEHKRNAHGTSSTNVTPSLDSLDLSIYGNDSGLRQTLSRVKHLLVETVHVTTHQHIYNFPMHEPSHETLDNHLDYVFNRLPCAAKINISLGYVLRNVDTEEFTYFYPQYNTSVFKFPVTVSDVADLEFLKDRTGSENLFEHMMHERPDTKSRFYTMTNVVITATLLRKIPLGCANVELPDFLLTSRSVFTLLIHDGHRFNDYLCLFRAVSMHMLGTYISYALLESKTSELFNLYTSKNSVDPLSFQGVSEEEFPEIENLFKVDIVIYGAQHSDNRIYGYLQRRSIAKNKNKITLLRYGEHLCYIPNPTAFFHAYRCETCDKYFPYPSKLEKHLTSCTGRVKNKYPGGVYSLTSTLFDRLEAVNIKIPEAMQYYTNFAVFDFESMCQAASDLNDSAKQKWVGKHIPISVSVLSNMAKEPLFLCNENPEQLIKDFWECLQTIVITNKSIQYSKFKPFVEELDDQITTISNELLRRKVELSQEDCVSPEELEQMFTNPENDFQDITETSSILTNSHKHSDIFSNPASELQYDNLENVTFYDSDMEWSDDDIDSLTYISNVVQFNLEKDTSLKQLHRTLSYLRQDFENYMTTLPVFGFNSSKYDLNLIKEHLIPYLVREKQLSPNVIKRSNQYVCFEAESVKFVDILNFLGGATDLSSFLKAYKADEGKGYFPYEFFDCPEKLKCSMLPSYNDFFSKLKNCNPLDAAYSKYLKMGQTMSRDEVFKKMKINAPPPSGEDNYQAMLDIWVKFNMKTLRDFLEWYNNKDVVPTLQALQKKIMQHHKLGVDFLKCGNTLPFEANRLLHQSTSALFYPFGEKDVDLAEKMRSDGIVGGPSLVFTRKAVVGESTIRCSNNLVQTIVGIDASQLYPYSMCHEMPTGQYTRWEITNDSRFFKPVKNHRLSLENRVIAHLQNQRTNCKIIATVTTGTQYTIGPYFVDGFCKHCNTVFEVNGCYWHYHVKCMENKLDGDKLVSALKRREHDRQRAEYLNAKGFQVIQVWECEFWDDVRNDKSGLKQFMKEHFPYQPQMSEETLIRKISNGQMFGYAQLDIEIPEDQRYKFKDFPPIFKNVNVGRDDIGEHMKEIAIGTGSLKKPQKMLISSCFLTNGLMITPMIAFLVQLGAKITKVYRFVQYQPMKCFQSFVQTIVDARREGDKNTESTVLAETMKLIGNSAYGVQIMDRRKHTSTKYANDSTVDNMINNKLFKDFNMVSDGVYEITLAKAEIKHKEPIVLGFFILQYAKLRMLELVYNFFVKFCDQDMYEYIEMDTDSLYMSLGASTLDGCIRPDMKDTWEKVRSADCIDDFKADSIHNFFPRTCCPTHIQHDKREPGLFKEEFRATEMIALCSKTYMCYNKDSDTVKFSSKGLNKNFVDEPLAKYRKVMADQTGLESINRGFRTINNSIRTYEMKKKGLSYFYPKRIVHSDGIHTSPLSL